MDWYRSADADFGGDGTYYVGFTDFSEIEKSADNHVPCRTASGYSTAAIRDGIGFCQIMESAACISIRNAGSVKQRITMWNMWISLSKWDNYKGKIVIKVMHMYGQACG